MTSLAAGIVSAGLKIGSSIISGGKKKKASRKAEAALVASQREAIAAAERIQAQQQTNLQPYSEAGQIGLNRITGHLDDDFLTSFNRDDLANDPGFRFRVEEGNRTLDRRANAGPGIFSGRQLRASERYGQDMAMDEFDRARTRFNEDRDSRYTKLYGLANLGQTAVSGTNASLSELGATQVAGARNIGTVQASGLAERGLIGANTWSTAIDSAISAIQGGGLKSLGI